MSRLSDLYKAMETLRKEGLSLNDDLERQVSELEEDIIKKEILPVVTETIEFSASAIFKPVISDLVAPEFTQIYVGETATGTATFSVSNASSGESG